MARTTDGYFSEKTGFPGSGGGAEATLGARIFRGLAVVFTVLALFMPLLWFLDYLKSLYGSSVNLIGLRWFELLAVLVFVVLPFLALSALRIRWNKES